MLFRNKLQILLILLVGISCGLLLWLSLRKANRLAFELIQEKVYSVAVSTAPRIDGDRVAELTSPDQDGSSEYLTVRDKLRAVRDANGEGALPIRFVYLMRPLEDGTWEYIVDAEEKGDDRSALGDKVHFNSPAEIPPLEVASVDDHFVNDSFGTWLTAFAPVSNSAGETVALVGIDIEAHRIQAMLRQLLFGDLAAMFVALLLASALAAWLSRKITQPLTELRDFVREIGRGNFSKRLDVRTKDEFGELAASINQMAEGLEERESLKGALVNYVRSQAADAKIEGEGVAITPRRITVLLAELCGFRQLSSKLGSERVFALLNEYFSTMIDVVLRHGGSLEKSTDESVIAIFGGNGEDHHQERHAIEAAMAMRLELTHLLEEWNVQTNKPVHLEVGIHSGNALVTCSATRDQLDYDSVHNVVAVAADIVRIGKERGCGLTVSDRTAELLHHTFPLEAVDEDELDFVLFRVIMPQPTRR